MGQLFNDFDRLSQLNIQKETLQALDLAEYANDSRITKEHAAAIDKLVRIFLNRLID